MAQVSTTEVLLKDQRKVTLRSPLASDAGPLLQHLRRGFQQYSRNMNHPARYWDTFSVEEEEKILQSFLSAPEKFMLSAFAAEVIVGNLAVFGMAGEFQKHNCRLGMGIEESFQGCGLGAQMLEHALSEAVKLGFKRMELNVRCFNHGAIALYEKMGFRRVGLLKNAALIDGEFFDEYLYERDL